MSLGLTKIFPKNEYYSGEKRNEVFTFMCNPKYKHSLITSFSPKSNRHCLLCNDVIYKGQTAIYKTYFHGVVYHIHAKCYHEIYTKYAKPDFSLSENFQNLKEILKKDKMV